MSRKLWASRTGWLALAGVMLAAAPLVAITYGQPETEAHNASAKVQFAY